MMSVSEAGGERSLEEQLRGLGDCGRLATATAWMRHRQVPGAGGIGVGRRGRRQHLTLPLQLMFVSLLLLLLLGANDVGRKSDGPGRGRGRMLGWAGRQAEICIDFSPSLSSRRYRFLADVGGMGLLAVGFPGAFDGGLGRSGISGFGCRESSSA
ncbi:hypothetical protein LZ30DRAFT_732538 [Colletotrichum cereale]|nr:hypothetical protein LZ30DRAFT_732538 [Colletotrichum cereale]